MLTGSVPARDQFHRVQVVEPQRAVVAGEDHDPALVLGPARAVVA